MMVYDIVAWLDGVRRTQVTSADYSCPPPTATTSTRKRHHPPSPKLSSLVASHPPQWPLSICAGITTAPPTSHASKRLRRGDGDDVDATPRPAPSRAPISLPDSSTEAFSSALYGDSGRTTSSRGSRRSPTKQLQQMALASRNPVKIRQIDLADSMLPGKLSAVIRDLSQFAKGRGVIAQSMQANVLDARSSNVRLHDIDNFCFLSPDLVDRLANPQFLARYSSTTCPSSHRVFQIFHAAKECHVSMHAEPSWNMLVHSQILGLSAAQRWQRGGDADIDTLDSGDSDSDHCAAGPVRFMPCTTARILGAWRGSGAGSSKMIDFSLFIDPSGFDEPAVTAIESMRKSLPGLSINHTDYAPLHQRPIVLSIETKTTGHQLLDAEVQVGVWMAAHWQMLAGLARQQSPQSGTLGTNTDDGEAMLDQALPSFLPAIVVQGHEWHFLATTRTRECTILWSKLTFGSSETILGIYQIVCVLQYLASWAELAYWPQFRQSMLGLPAKDSSMAGDGLKEPAR